MIFLVILFFFLIYLAISTGVVLAATRWAKKRNRRPWLWGGLAALVMYNLVFWDWVPTLVAHKYYCSTQAGFWVYKTPEEWVKENPGVAETLTWKESRNGYLRKSDRLNERLVWQTQQWHHRVLPVTVTTRSIIDEQKHEVLLKATTVASGYGPLGVGGRYAWKFWVGSESCTPYPSLGDVSRSYEQIGRKVK